MLSPCWAGGSLESVFGLVEARQLTPTGLFSLYHPACLEMHFFVSPRLEVCDSFLASGYIFYILAVMFSSFGILINNSMYWFEVIINSK